MWVWGIILVVHSSRDPAGGGLSVIRIQRWVQKWALVAGMVGLLAGCGGDSDDSTPGPPVTATPAPIAWQRAGDAIGLANFAEVQVTGLLQRHTQTVNAVAFNSTMTRLATVAPDNIVMIWNMANGESLYFQTVSGGRYVFFGPDDETLITVGSRGEATIYAIDPGPSRQLIEQASFDGYPSMAGVVIQSPDRTLLAFGGADGGIALWRLPAGELLTTFQAHEGAIQHMTFSPDGSMLASVDTNHAAVVWSMPDGEAIFSLNTRETADPMRTVFAPDSQQIAAALVTGLHVFDVATESLVSAIDTATYATTSRIAYSPDGAVIAACGRQPVVGLWRADGEFLGGLQLQEQGCRALAFSPDGNLLLVLPEPGRQFYLWDISVMAEDIPVDQKFPRVRTRDSLGLYPQAAFFDAVWSPDGRYIALIDELGPVYILSAPQ